MTERVGKLVWLVAEEKGGIRDYADELWPKVSERWRSLGGHAVRIDSPPLKTRKAVRELIVRIRAEKASLIHIQHEFGLFGSKIPFLYRFPQLASALRRGAPCVATAHNVIDSKYKLSYKGKSLFGAVVRWSFNLTLLPIVRANWIRGTWGHMDAVIVHSKHQIRPILAAGCPVAEVIPHFVPRRAAVDGKKSDELIVFGFFSADKAQDIAIRSLRFLNNKNLKLILAGGVRRGEDAPYLSSCEQMIEALNLVERVSITGYIPAAEIDFYYARAQLVIAPFRETTGSGSLAQALARSLPILASDLSLNVELNERVPGCLALFQSENPQDCAAKIEALLADPQKLQLLREKAGDYAALCSPDRIAEQHIDLYKQILAR